MEGTSQSTIYSSIPLMWGRGEPILECECMLCIFQNARKKYVGLIPNY